MTKKTRHGLIIAAAIIMITAGPVFAQDFETEPDGTGGVVISGYRGSAESVVIPAAIGGKPVTGIRKYAFGYNTSLTSVTIPAGVTSIGEGAFVGCTGLTAIAVSAENRQYRDIEGVLFTRDGKTLHSYPPGRKNAYQIPAGVAAISKAAFMETGLTTVTIPASVISIGEGAFVGCTGLTAISVSAENRQYRDIEGVLFTRNGKTLLAYPAGKKTAYQIPDGVTAIGYGAFAGCTGLTTITIPASVTTIGEWAFYECIGLTSVTIPASVTTIGEWAFVDCTGLTAVTIPASVTSIGEGAFYECTGLDKTFRDAIVKRFGDRVF